MLQNTAIPLTATTKPKTLAFVLVNRLKNIYWKEMTPLDVDGCMYGFIEASPFFRGIILMLALQINNPSFSTDNFSKFATVKFLNISASNQAVIDIGHFPANLEVTKIQFSGNATIQQFTLLFSFLHLKYMLLDIYANVKVNDFQVMLICNLCGLKTLIWRVQGVSIFNIVNRILQQELTITFKWEHFEFGRFSLHTASGGICSVGYQTLRQCNNLSICSTQARR